MKKICSLLLCSGLFISSCLFSLDNASASENNETTVTFSTEEYSYLVETVDSNAVTCYVDSRKRGATDEYYYLESHRTYGSEFLLQVERYSDYYQAGLAIVTLATAKSVIWVPVNAATLNAVFNIVKGFVPSVSAWYHTTVNHYAVYGEARYRVEVAGQFSRYAVYENLKVPTRKVYNYS